MVHVCFIEKFLTFVGYNQISILNNITHMTQTVKIFNLFLFFVNYITRTVQVTYLAINMIQRINLS